MRSSRRPLVEILYFDGCPNHEPALAAVERVDRELGTNADVRLVNVPDHATAERVRFLGHARAIIIPEEHVEGWRLFAQ